MSFILCFLVLNQKKDYFRNYKMFEFFLLLFLVNVVSFMSSDDFKSCMFK